MSSPTFWSDACRNAVGRPLPTLLNALYAVCGVTVRQPPLLPLGCSPRALRYRDDFVLWSETPAERPSGAATSQQTADATGELVFVGFGISAPEWQWDDYRGLDVRGKILLMLVNDVSLRALIPGELAKGFGFFQSKPATAFSPVAVTPDELGPAWHDAKVHLPLLSFLNGQPFGKPQAGVDMTFNFPQLIAHVAATRRLGAGAIVGSGTVSNYDRSLGSSCLAEKRTLEQIEFGAPRTPFLKFGDRVRIEMFDAGGASLFGAIDQRVAAA